MEFAARGISSLSSSSSSSGIVVMLQLNWNSEPQLWQQAVETENTSMSGMMAVWDVQRLPDYKTRLRWKWLTVYWVNSCKHLGNTPPPPGESWALDSWQGVPHSAPLHRSWDPWKCWNFDRSSWQWAVPLMRMRLPTLHFNTNRLPCCTPTFEVGNTVSGTDSCKSLGVCPVKVVHTWKVTEKWPSRSMQFYALLRSIQNV